MKLHDLELFYQDETFDYFCGRRFNGNAELVCDGLAIETGGNTPEAECTEIVDAQVRAWEEAIGYVGGGEIVTFFSHARIVTDEVFLARAENADDGDRQWIDSSQLPAEACEIIDRAQEAAEAAHYKAVSEVEAEHSRKADQWLSELVDDDDEVDMSAVMAVAEDPESCISDDIRAELEAVVDGWRNMKELVAEKTVEVS